MDSVLSRVAPARSRGGLPVMGGVTGAVGGQTIIAFASPLLPCYSASVPVVVTCAQCREEVLEADLIGDEEEECILRDHLLAVHPKTVQPETLGAFLKHFVVTERPPLAA